MKIDENLVNKGKIRLKTKSSSHPFYPNSISDDNLFFSLIFMQDSGYNIPFVERTPVIRASIAQASSIALPAALNMDSMI